MPPSRLLGLALAAVLTATGCSADPGSSGAPPAGASTSTAPHPADPGQDAGARGPVRPRTAGQAARLLTAAERAVRDPDTPRRELVRAARQQQLVYRVAGTRPAWDARLLAGVPGPLRVDVRANLDSRREFRSMHTTLSDTLPAGKIVAPAPERTLLRAYRAGEAAYGVPWEYLAAINLVETGMGRIRGTSVAGARGPMQFLPSTWAQWGRGDIDDPRDAVLGAARYLRHHGGDRPAGMAGALYRYNNDVRYVRGVTRIAEVLQRDPRALAGYYHWDVVYLTDRGDVRLPVGYDRRTPVGVGAWLRRHPGTAL